MPTPRSRGDACKTALGAGGLVVAGSVLGAALLAAAGVGGPLPFGQGGDDGAGQFQGEGTLVKPGTAYGSVRGRDVVARSGLLRAIAYYTPFGSSTGAAGAGAGARGGAAVVPGARRGRCRFRPSPRPVLRRRQARRTGIGTPVVGGGDADGSPSWAPVDGDAAGPVLAACRRRRPSSAATVPSAAAVTQAAAAASSASVTAPLASRVLSRGAPTAQPVASPGR